MMFSSISIREVRPEAERSTVVDLLEKNLPEAAIQGRFEWLYLQNPYGHARVWLADDGVGHPIGTSAALPRLFSVGKETAQALILSDFAVDPAYRSLGPALALVRATLRPVWDGTFDFALDWPSESMRAVYKRIGGKELSALVRCVKVLKPSAVAKRRWGPGVRASFVGAAGDFGLLLSARFRRRFKGLTFGLNTGDYSDEFARLEHAVASRCTIFGARDPKYLEWRFARSVRFSHETITVRASGELLAYAILRSDGPALTVVEFICTDDQQIEQALFAAISAYASDLEADTMQASAVVGTLWFSILQRCGFAARDRAAGPMVFVPPTSTASALLTDSTQWWITDGDRDG